MRIAVCAIVLAVAATGCLGSDNTADPIVDSGLPLSVTETAELAFPNLVGAGIAAVASAPDFSAVSLSLLDKAGNIVAESFLDSGSTVPRLSTAFSNDVVAAATPTPDGSVVVIDRANSVLTWIDPDDRTVIRQRVVGEPFFGHNPQDYLELGASKGYVTRWDAVRDDDGNVESGSDILVFNPANGAALGTIDLSPAVAPVPNTTAATLARPTRLLAVDDYIYVVLQNMTDDGSFVTGPGTVAVIDPAADTLIADVELGGLENCDAAVYSKPASEVYIVCSGNFAKGILGQFQGSGVAVLKVTEPTAPTVARSIKAQKFANRPLANSIGLVTATQVAVVENGLIDFSTFEILANENVYVLDTIASTDPAAKIVSVAGAFQLMVFADPVNARLYVGDADFADPHLAVFAITRETGGVALMAEHRLQNGFAVRSLGLY